MDKLTRHPLSARFIVTISVFTLMMCLGLGVFSYKNAQRITENNKEYLESNTKSVAKTLDAVLGEGYENIRIVSAYTSESLDSPEFDISDSQKLIKDSVFDFMEFADKEGMDHNITGSVSCAADREYYLEGMKGNVGMELIYESRATHETLLMYYSPLYYQDEIIGSIVGVY